MPSFGTIIWWAGGGLLFLGIWKAGLAMLKSMTSPAPPPPPKHCLEEMDMIAPIME